MNKQPKLKYFPISVYCNTCQNRLPVRIEAESDVGIRNAALFEHSGEYWFCLYYGQVKINSIGFVSLRNCVSALKMTFSSLGWVLLFPDDLAEFVAFWEHSIKRSAQQTTKTIWRF